MPRVIPLGRAPAGVLTFSPLTFSSSPPQKCPGNLLIHQYPAPETQIHTAHLLVTLSIALYCDCSLALAGSPAMDLFTLPTSHTPLLTQLRVHGPSSFACTLASDLNFVSHLPSKRLKASNCHFSPSLHQSSQGWQKEEGKESHWLILTQHGLCAKR